MTPAFMIYGANGYVGEAAVRLAVASGLQPIIAGRNEISLKKLANELGLKFRVFDLNDQNTVNDALKDVKVILHCAGPYIHTYQPMVEACLKNGTHYLDLTGEIPVYSAIAARGAEARARGVMLLPGVGFDVVPTDCLALHLKQRLPTATHLTLAFQSEGPAGLPPGTQKTAIELLTFGDRVRKAGRLQVPEESEKLRLIDFGNGPLQAVRLTWGDVYTAYHSTGIPNIEDYTVLPESTRKQMALMRSMAPLLKLPGLRILLKRGVRPGATDSQRTRTSVHVWGEVMDEQGRKATARLHGPEAGLVWTTRAALAAVNKVLSGSAPTGYQTPASAYGPDFVLECEGILREDVD